MAYEISQELEEKLKLIELETDFFSCKPEKPVRSRYLVWIVTVLMVAGIWSALKSENELLLIYFVAFAVVYFLGYQQEKRLFNLYSSACEILNYYKKADTPKI